MALTNVQFGRAVFELRREKGLTQQQLADLMGISNKTVSKWECGLGLPDVSSWAALSAALGADVQKILDGEFTPNSRDVGKMSRVRFYVCPGCGNILTSTGKASVSCCGRRLSPLKVRAADMWDDVCVEMSDSDYYISFRHEMSREHYIVFAAYVTIDRVIFVRLYPEQEAAVRIPATTRGGELYLYCMQHGLRKYTALP